MNIIVVGGGVAGMFCSGLLASYGHNVVLLEQNDKLGKKMFITGKGRCNITNDCDRNTLLDNIVTNSKFMMSALSKFTPQMLIKFCESNGLKLKTERGNRVFPLSDKSSDVIKCFENFAIKNGVKVRLNCKVEAIVKNQSQICGVKLASGQIVEAEAIIIATGGMSYPMTGSTGDGYKFAKTLGHNVVAPKPALTPILTEGVQNLAGLSLKNVMVSILDSKGKTVADEFGEMIFTHNGMSGPVILSLSSRLNKFYINGKLNDKFNISIDLKPALSFEKMQDKLLREFAENKNIIIKNYLPSLMPKSLIDKVLAKSGISEKTPLNSITKLQRDKLISKIKGIHFGVLNLDKIELGIITSGGIDVKQINPKDMQSKLVDNLYFIGEVVDTDALTGGFNIHLALAMAYSVAESLKSAN